MPTNVADLFRLGTALSRAVGSRQTGECVKFVLINELPSPGQLSSLRNGLASTDALRRAMPERNEALPSVIETTHVPPCTLLNISGIAAGRKEKAWQVPSILTLKVITWQDRAAGALIRAPERH